MKEYTTGNNIVDAMASMQFTGNVIPQIWYQTILRDNGKPYLLAITLLADIVYWYRPTELRDEKTGRFLGYAKKFKDDDLLQRSYAQFASMYGESKRSITDAIVKLEQLGVIKRVLRTIDVGGVAFNNVLFIELFPEMLYKLTYPVLSETECNGKSLTEKMSAENVLEETVENENNEQKSKNDSDTPITKFRERGHTEEIPLSQNLVRGVTKESERGHEEKGEGSRNLGTRNTKITTKTTTKTESSSYAMKNEKQLLQEEEIYKRQINYKAAERQYPEQIVKTAFEELMKRNEKYRRNFTADMFLRVCKSIASSKEPIVSMPGLINWCYDRICFSVPGQKFDCGNNRFNQFMQREDYDYAELEKLLISN